MAFRAGFCFLNLLDRYLGAFDFTVFIITHFQFYLSREDGLFSM